MELPTTDIKDEGDGDDCDSECNNHDKNPHLELLQQCNNQFCDVIDDTNETTPLITPQESVQRTYIEKLYKQLLSVRKRENVLFKLRAYRNFDRYLSKLREDPFFQD